MLNPPNDTSEISQYLLIVKHFHGRTVLRCHNLLLDGFFILNYSTSEDMVHNVSLIKRMKDPAFY